MVRSPGLMNYSGPHPAVKHCAMQHSLDYLHEALQLWLSAGEKINFSEKITNFNGHRIQARRGFAR